MKKTVYSKYSNDREEKYRIRTDIIEEDGLRYVTKNALGEKSRKHIQQMFHNYGRLQKQFEGTRFTMNRTEQMENGLKFEFLKGSSLENLLDDALKEERIRDLVEMIREFSDELRKNAVQEFVPDEGFRQIFGDVSFERKLYRLDVSDIDMIFPNIIVEDEKWNVIDYEWSFDFAIPVDFILYRSLHYYCTGQRAALLKENCNLYRELGFTVAECKTFEEMEKRFQSYLLGNNHPLWQMYPDIRGELYFPNGAIEANRREVSEKRVGVIKQFSDGRLEHYFMNPVFDHGNIHVEVMVDPTVTMVCIEPAQRFCCICLHAVVGEGMGSYQVNYGTNGFSKDNRTIYYTSHSPQIIVGDIRPGTSKICADFQIEYPNRDYVLRRAMEVEQERKMEEHMKEALHEIACLKMENEQKNSEMQHLRSQIQELESNGRYKELYENVIHSRSWRLTKPLRGEK